MAKRFAHLSVITLFLLLVLCSSGSAQSNPPLSVSFDFRQGMSGWQAGFADYSTYTTYEYFEFRTELRSLPAELQPKGTGFYIQGKNLSDDLFMFIKRKLGPGEGILAGQKYQVYYTIVFASNAQTGCGGVGGSPGESVLFKAGASPMEPFPILDSMNTWRMNVNKGEPAAPGELVASRVSSIANGLPCDLRVRPYVSLTRNHLHQGLVSANAAGELWLLIGTDSGFEGLTGIYYQSIHVFLVPMDQLPAAPIILEREDAAETVAVDSVTRTASPFGIENDQNFSADHRTRLMLFARNLGLQPGEGASAVTVEAADTQHRRFLLPVEFVGVVPTFNWLYQINVKLPDELRNAGDIKITITVNGVTSNRTTIRMKAASP